MISLKRSLSIIKEHDGYSMNVMQQSAFLVMALVSDVYCDFVTFPFGIWYLGTGVVLDCIDSWSLLSFLL